MSTSEEILEVYLTDIIKKTNYIRDHQGMINLIGEYSGMSIEEIKLVNDEDLEFLSKIGN